MGKVLDAIVTRRSIRKYKQDPIPQEVLDRILEAALYSPSGIGKQSPIIVCVQNKELRDRIEKMNSDILVSVGRNGDNPFFGAPVVVVVLADRKVPTHVEDGSIVCPYISHRRGKTFIGEGDYIILDDDGTKHVCGGDKIFQRYEEVK